MSTPIVFWQLPAAWGLPSASPFCMKLETWLRMVELPYRANTLKRLPASPTSKVPYVQREDGSILSDTSIIIDTLGREYGISLDEDLSEEAEGQSILLQRTIEEHLYWALLCERWLDDSQWPRIRDTFFASMPPGVRDVVATAMRYKVKRDAWGHGMGRLTPARRQERAQQDVRALAIALGAKKFLLGSPHSIDASAYGLLANILESPLRSPLRDWVLIHDNLCEYHQRMKQRYWSSS